MWKMPSQALMWDRKAFPSPCPEWAPFTRPAMSTTFRKAGTLLKRQNKGVSETEVYACWTPAVRTHYHNTHLAGLWYWQRKSKRSSGTGTLLSLGSIVQNGVQGNSFFVMVQFSFIILGQVVLSSISCSWGVNDAQHFLKRYPTCILSCRPAEGFHWPMWMHETDQDVSIITRCFHDRSKPPLPIIHTSEAFSWTTLAYIRNPELSCWCWSWCFQLICKRSVVSRYPRDLQSFLSSWNVTVVTTGPTDCFCIEISGFQLIIVLKYILTWNKEELHILYVATSPIIQLSCRKYVASGDSLDTGFCCFSFYGAPNGFTDIPAVAGGKEVPLSCEAKVFLVMYKITEVHKIFVLWCSTIWKVAHFGKIWTYFLQVRKSFPLKTMHWCSTTL